MFKLCLMSLIVLFSLNIFADFTFIVPQKPGGGTSIWATFVAKELEKKLGESIIIQHLPGARDQYGFDKFHKKLRFNNKVVMVSHGGNAVSYLQEKVDYDYGDYDVIAIMHNNIIVSKNKLLDWRKEKIIFSLLSGAVPEAMAMVLLTDGHDKWESSWEKYIKPVKGMSQAENRLAFRRGEVNVTRENPAAHKKHVAPLKQAEVFFNHGLFNFKTGNFDKDPNFQDTYTFEELYSKTWKRKPSGKLYNAYKMVKAWRDGMQKALWVNKKNPNRNRLIKAVADMLSDNEALVRLQKALGKYPWDVGEKAAAFTKALYPLVTKDNLETLVAFNKKVLGLDSFFNPKRINSITSENKK